jgi:putative glutathione S-transferase
MGRLKSGKWIQEGVIPDSHNGEFYREEAKFRNTIKEGGKYPPETGRYHLYISLACPWASRAYIMMKLKKLERVITISIVNPHMSDNGWTFKEDFPGVIPDSVLSKKYLYEVYQESDPNFSGKVTVPVLFDKKTNTIVSNESSEIIRMMNTAFNKITGDSNDFYPETLRSEIDQVNSFVYDNINNGVYKTGFAKNQDAYNKNFNSLFKALDKIEERLEGKETLVGMILTEADLRLYTTLVRFDPVYYVHFKCNNKMIREYKNLSRYLSNLYYNVKAFKDTTNFDHIKEHYYFSHKQLNPNQIVPRGPEILVPEINTEKTNTEPVKNIMPKQESVFDEVGVS